MLNLGFVKRTLQQHLDDKSFELTAEPLAGGDSHQNYVLTLNFDQNSASNKLPKYFFIKANSSADILESEFKSLRSIGELLPSYYPKALFTEREDNLSILVMSYHHLSPITPSNAADAGRDLARHHRISHDKFGWSMNNYIGLTPQTNEWNESWITFFREQRLLPMMRRALDQGLPSIKANQIKQSVDRLDKLLSHNVTPSLIHGDLWSGNFGFDKTTNKMLFYDPAPYFGDREVDIAMTTLFGKQPQSFYQAYQAEWPLAVGYEERICVYNLYHALNHFVLFGSSYIGLIDYCLNQITRPDF